MGKPNSYMRKWLNPHSINSIPSLPYHQLRKTSRALISCSLFNFSVLSIISWLIYESPLVSDNLQNRIVLRHCYYLMQWWSTLPIKRRFVKWDTCVNPTPRLSWAAWWGILGVLSISKTCVITHQRGSTEHFTKYVHNVMRETTDRMCKTMLRFLQWNNILFLVARREWSSIVRARSYRWLEKCLALKLPGIYKKSCSHHA